MSLSDKVLEQLQAKFKKRFDKSKEYIPQMDTFVTRVDSIEITAELKDKKYACYIDRDGFLCGCIDNLTRKRICKHLIAGVIRACEEKKITELDLLQILVWRKN